MGRGVIHFNLIKTSHANHGCLPGREEVEVEKGRNIGRYNNSGPTGDALWVIHSLEKVPETPGPRGCPGPLALPVAGQLG